MNNSYERIIAIRNTLVEVYALLVKGCCTALIGLFSQCVLPVEPVAHSRARGGDSAVTSVMVQYTLLPEEIVYQRNEKKIEHAIDLIKRVLNELPYSYQFIAALSL